MTNVLDLQPSGFVLSDTDGTQPFSTDIPMLHVLDVVEGSLFYPFASSDYSQHLRREQSELISAIDPACTHAFGSCYIVWGGASQSAAITAGAGYRWFWNGSLVVFFERGEEASGSNSGYVFSNTRYSLCSWTQITPRCEGGNLYFDEKTFIRGNISAPLYGPFQRQAFTLHYKLKCAAFAP